VLPVGGSMGDAHFRDDDLAWQADGAAVSILKLDKVATPRLKLEAAQHGFQRIRTLRHPYILQYLDGAELEKEMVVVTEPVTSLGEWLQSLGGDMREEQIAWGLRCLLSALHFLSNDCKMTHGLICPDTVFVTRAGDWKLGGKLRVARDTCSAS
jgi:SCY1-like protein 1